MSIEMAGIISEGYNIGKVIGFFEENTSSSRLGKVIVQIGKEIFIVDYPMPDGEYEIIKMEYPIGSTVFIGMYDGGLYIERSIIGELKANPESYMYVSHDRSSCKYDL